MTTTAKKPLKGKYRTADAAFARAEQLGVGVRVHADGSADLTYDPDEARRDEDEQS